MDDPQNIPGLFSIILPTFLNNILAVTRRLLLLYMKVSLVMYIFCKKSSFFFTFIFHCFLYKDIKKRLFFR